jgi:PAS domain S-box-containing protein
VDSFARDLLDGIHAHVAVLDESGVIIAVNRAWSDFAVANGASRDTGIGTRYVEAYDPASGAGVEAQSVEQAIVDVIARRRERFELVYPCHAPSEERWFSMEVRPCGERGAIVTHTDISSIARSHLGLSELNRVLELVATDAPLERVFGTIAEVVEARIPGSTCTLMLLDQDGTTLRLVPGSRLPTSYSSLVRTLAIGPVAGSCGTAVYRREPVFVEDLDRDPLWNDYPEIQQAAAAVGLRSCWSLPVTSRHGRVLGAFAVYQKTVALPDVHQLGTIRGGAYLAAVALEHESNQRELRESEERFRLLVGAIRDYALFMTSPNGTIVTWNSGAAAVFGYAADEVIGESIALLFQQTPQECELDLSVAAADGRFEVDARYLRKAGEGFEASVIIRPLIDDTRTLCGFAVVVRDLTERVHLEHQLRHAQKMEAIGLFAGGIAHDFNNLLTVIIGCSDYLDQALPEDSQAREDVEDIKSAAGRAASLTRQLLAFSRRQLVEPIVLDLNVAVQQAAALLERLIGEHITVSIELAEALPRVRADRGLLEQVIMNLTLNARDAMPEGGVLILRTATRVIDVTMQTDTGALAPGLYDVVSIIDQGVGMSEEVRGKIFQPFFTTKGPGAGTGLGLAVVYGVINQLGGGIAVTSVPGRGTRFDVLLPATEHSSGVLRRVDGHVRPGTGCRVLLVEDEERLRRLVRRMLEQHGYVVMSAPNGTAALEIAAQHTFDVLVTDVVMPQMNGRALADELRKTRPKLRVLYMTGYTDDAVLRSGLAHGTDHILQKPFTSEALLASLAQVLDSST